MNFQERLKHKIQHKIVGIENSLLDNPETVCNDIIQLKAQRQGLLAALDIMRELNKELSDATDEA